VSTPSAGLPSVRGFHVPLGGQLTDLGFAAGWRVVRAMPEFAARNAFEAGAMYASRGGGPDQLRKNLARVIGVPAAEVPGSLIRASLASYARYWREAFRLPSMNHQVLARRLNESVQGDEHVKAALDAGRGAVLALPHSGNWDMAGVWLTNTYGAFATVAERLKPESLYKRFIDYRESLGFEVLPLTGGAPPFEILAERLRGNGLVCLMSDRDLTRSGVQVDFFGEPTRLPAGPAKLALATGAALLPAHCFFEPDVSVTAISPPLDTSSGDVDAITQALADQFAVNIAAHPADWHMLQPQWIADLSEERRARLSGIGGQERSDPGIGIGGQERSDPGIGIGGQERSDPGIGTGES
jgi:lauroyl/myristoyl acyltransferase